MTATFVHAGDTIDYTPGSDLSAGDVVVENELVGIAPLDIASGKAGSLTVTGVWDLPKTTGVGTAIGNGAIVYWDATNKVATTNDATGTNKKLGKTVAAAADDDATVRVRLSQ